MLYAIHSVSQSRFNRTARAAAGTPGARKQYIMGSQHRLIKQRPVVIDEEKLVLHLAELREKVAAHLIEVRTVEGLLVDIGTFKVVEEPKAAPPLPEPPLDSAKNDSEHVGNVMPIFVEGELPGKTHPKLFPEETTEDLEEAPPPDGAALAALPAEEPEQEFVDVGAQKKGKGKRR